MDKSNYVSKPTSRKLHQLSARKLLVKLIVLDSPASGEDYLSNEELVDSILGKDVRAGVEILSDEVEEIREL